MEHTTDNKPKKVRRLEGFDPCGPVAAMIDIETRKKPRGSKTKLFENAIAEHLRRKYPKLYKRFQILRDEAAA